MLLMLGAASALMLVVGVWIIVSVIQKERERMEQSGMDAVYEKWLEGARKAERKVWSECV